MVTIINYKERETDAGEVFYVLELQGGIEMVKSQKTNKFYVTARKATIPSTFDEETCKSIVGTEMPGRIEKVEVEPYEFTIKETGEIIELDFRYEYTPEEVEKEPSKIERSNSTIDEFVKKENPVKFFSENGVQ